MYKNGEKLRTKFIRLCTEELKEYDNAKMSTRCLQLKTLLSLLKIKMFPIEYESYKNKYLIKITSYNPVLKVKTEWEYRIKKII